MNSDEAQLWICTTIMWSSLVITAWIGSLKQHGVEWDWNSSKGSKIENINRKYTEYCLSAGITLIYQMSFLSSTAIDSKLWVSNALWPQPSVILFSFHLTIMRYFVFVYLSHKIPIKYIKVCGCNLTKCGKVQGAWMLLHGAVFRDILGKYFQGPYCIY